MDDLSDTGVEEVVVDDVSTDTPTQDAAHDTSAPDAKDEGGDKSLLEGGGDDKAVTTPADWPEDWRAKMAADDKEAKLLDRYKSPKDVMKALREAQTKISSGQLKAALPDDATEEQIAAYRKDNGIPEKPDGYLEALPSGLVIGDDDKPMVESFLASAHGKNASPEVVASALEWYYQTQEDQAAAKADADKAYRQESVESLRAEWGGEYKSNLNSALNFLDTAPVADDGTPFKDMLLGARLADGTAFGDNPVALRWLADLAAEKNPAGYVSPGDGGSQVESVKAEIASIEKVMREDRAAYNKDTKMQERLRVLYDAEAKLGK